MTTQKDFSVKIKAIQKELEHQFIAREEAIRASILGVLCKQHVLLIAPPGTAKTALLSALNSHFTGTTFFRRQLNEYTSPDEIFGPISIKELETNDIYKRKLEHKAADSHFVLLDEVFKAGPAILNTLLSLMEERGIDNDGGFHDSPIISIFGATNELPEEDDGLAAFFDRFLIRLALDYIEEEDQMKTMIFGSEDYIPREIITQEELKEIHEKVLNLPWSVEAGNSLMHMWKFVQENLDHKAGDRRFKRLRFVMQADSFMKGFSTVQPESIDVAKFILWMSPEQASEIKQEISQAENASGAHARELQKEIEQDIINAGGNQGELMQILATIKDMLDELRGEEETETILSVRNWMAMKANELSSQLFSTQVS